MHQKDKNESGATLKFSEKTDSSVDQARLIKEIICVIFFLLIAPYASTLQFYIYLLVMSSKSMHLQKR